SAPAPRTPGRGRSGRAPWPARAGTAASASWPSRSRTRSPAPSVQGASMQKHTERSLVILLLDPEGQHTAIASAAPRRGHRVVPALIVLGSLVPDVVVVASQTADRDRQALARLQTTAPEVSVRVVDKPDGLATALVESPLLLN